jgi:hypothetical protein
MAKKIVLPKKTQKKGIGHMGYNGWGRSRNGRSRNLNRRSHSRGRERSRNHNRSRRGRNHSINRRRNRSRSPRGRNRSLGRRNRSLGRRNRSRSPRRRSRSPVRPIIPPEITRLCRKIQHKLDIILHYEIFRINFDCSRSGHLDLGYFRRTLQALDTVERHFRELKRSSAVRQIQERITRGDKSITILVLDCENILYKMSKESDEDRGYGIRKITAEEISNYSYTFAVFKSPKSLEILTEIDGTFKVTNFEEYSFMGQPKGSHGGDDIMAFLIWAYISRNFGFNKKKNSLDRMYYPQDGEIVLGTRDNMIELSIVS